MSFKLLFVLSRCALDDGFMSIMLVDVMNDVRWIASHQTTEECSLSSQSLLASEPLVRDVANQMSF